MNDITQYSVRRLECKSAAVQGTYQLCNCAIGGFTAIYLAYNGFSNTQIGLTSSLVYLFSVTIQLLLADYSDAHVASPIKYIISGMYIAAIALAAAVNYIPMPIAAMMVVFALAQAFSSATDCFISAMMMQFTNLGIPVRYGWPRSVGSITYAILALVLGWIIEEHSPAIVMPLYVGLAAAGIIAVSFMPQPVRYSDPKFRGAVFQEKKHISYRQMLSGNPTLILFIASICLCSAGSSPSYMFLIRVIERLGGNSSTLGLALFLQAVMELPSLCLSTYFVKKFDRRTVLMIAVGIRLVRLVGITFAPSLAVFFIITCIGGFGNGLFMFASVEFANSIVHDGERVRSQSLLAFSNTLGSVIGNGVAGLIIDALGLTFMLGSGSVLCLLGVVLMCICASVCAKQFKKESVS